MTKRIMRITLFISILGSHAASAQNDTWPKWYKADHPLPPEVVEALPRDIPGDNVIVRFDDEVGGPCYYYQITGLTYPLPTLRMIAEGSGDQPYCVM